MSFTVIYLDMKKQFYCIVDASGNPYSFTFNKNREAARNIYLTNGFSIPYSISLDTLDSMWQEKEVNGDRLVLCDIETNEEVKINVRD